MEANMKNGSIVSITHENVVITYNEAKDKWAFTLRGRERLANTLADAKKLIDKPVSVGKDKWEPIACFASKSLYAGSTDYVPAKITSIVEPTETYGSRMFRVTLDDGERGQRRFTSVLKDTPSNRAHVASLRELEAQREELNKQMSAVGEKLEHFSVNDFKEE